MKLDENVVELLKELSGVSSIRPEDRLQEELSMDSLSMVTLLIELENVFCVEFDEVDMNPYDLITVQDVVELMERYCGERHEETR